MFQKLMTADLTDNERKQCWILHHGPHAKEALCPMCGINSIKFLEKAGWECSHIVARKFCADPKSRFYLLPCCAACNKETGTRCIWNIMWERGRVREIKAACHKIYDVFSQLNESSMHDFDHMMWKVIRHLYGSEKHLAGGGIEVLYEAAIYQLLMLDQVEQVRAEVSRLNIEMGKRVELLYKLFADINRPAPGGGAKSIFQ